MKILKFSIKLLLFSFLFVILCIIGIYSYAYFSPTMNIKTTGQYYIYDDNEDLVFQGSSSNEWVSLDNISNYFINSIISAEDNNFYKHNGFDYLRIGKAMINNIKNKSIVEGASTISQQYIKNLFLDFDKTWSRKFNEALLTIKLETHYSKDDILNGYLNTINYGNGNYGIENASNFYFNKHASDLSLEESLLLAGIIKSPNKYNPITNYDLSVNRAKIIGKLMLDNGYISEEEYNNLFKDDVTIYGKNNEDDLKMIMYYQDAVYDELYSLDEIPESLIKTGGFKIYTSLNMDAQTYLENSINQNMSNSELQVASIIINPNNGNVMALSGGKDYSLSQYNRAISAERQVGSTIKPILYYSALENGMVSSSTFLSKETSFVFSNNSTYSPANYNNKYGNKEITMAAALSYSDNIYAVKTHLFLGEDNLVDIAKRMGINKSLDSLPSLALGTCNLSMYDYANAYTTLASGGYKRDLSFINKVTDLDGNVLYEKTYTDEIILNTNYTYIINELLTTTYNSTFKDYNNPTLMGISSKLNGKYAIKTGSTGTDCVVVGYNKNYLMMVWNGYDDNKGVEVSDGLISKNIWVDTMNYLNKEDGWYETPENIIGIPLNAIDGSTNYNKDNMYLFYYVKGSEEQYVSSFEDKKTID